MSNLESERVTEIFTDCLFREGEDTTDHVKAEGILHNVGFHPGRLEEYEDEILEMLLELPEEFQASVGGGMSFLNACVDKDGRQWTGEHRVMDQLFLLGTGIGRVKLCLPREVWDALPGGMPYYIVLDRKPQEMLTSEDVDEGARRFRATREHDADQERTYPFYFYETVFAEGK